MNVLEQISEPDAPKEAVKPAQVDNWRYMPGDIAQLWLDCKETGTNVISEQVLRELDTLLDQIKGEQPRALVIRSAKQGGFAAGAGVSLRSSEKSSLLGVLLRSAAAARIRWSLSATLARLSA